MMRPGVFLLMLVLTALAGCRPATPPPVAAAVEVAEEPGWRRAASAEDVARIDAVASAWSVALDAARQAGFRRQIESEGPLLEPDAALPRPAPTPGSYMCRLIRFGGADSDARAFTAYPAFFCHVGVAGDRLSITKQTGSERPAGYLWEDGDRPRLVFLGSLALGSEEEPGAYGEGSERDMAGLFERVGPLRFRLVIPRPRTGATLELFELVPAPVQHVG